MKTKCVKIRTEYIKLCQFLKFCGIAENGSQANELIRSGQILVNGQKNLQRGKKLKLQDTVQYLEEVFEVVLDDNSQR